MHTIKGGMSQLSEAFKKELKEHIKFRVTVTEIEYESSYEDLHRKVTVRGFKERKKDGKIWERSLRVTQSLSQLQSTSSGRSNSSRQQEGSNVRTKPLERCP